MPIKTLKTPLPPECRELWREAGQLLLLAQQCMTQGDAAGRDMGSCRELGEMYTRRWQEIGWSYYPEEMPPQVVQ